MAWMKPDDEWTADLGRRIKRLREARGMSQTELGKRSTQALGAIERGEQTMSLNALRKMAAALGVTYDQILGDPYGGDAEPDKQWHAGYRAGVADSAASLRDLLQKVEREDKTLPEVKEPV